MTDPADVLTRTFAAHEYLAPDALEVLAGLDDVRAARRSTRTALAVGSVLTVAAAGAVVALAANDHDGHRVADRPPAVSSSTSVADSAPPSSTTFFLGPAVFVAPHSLPADARRTLFGASTSEQQIGYDMHALGSSDLYVAFTLDKRGSLATDTKRGAQKTITVAGRPAHESGVPGSYQLTVSRRDGSLLTVVVQDNDTRGGPVSVAAMSSFARALVPKIDYRVGTAVLPPLLVSALPNGLDIAATQVGEERNNGVLDRAATSYTLSRSAHEAVSIESAQGQLYGHFQPSAPGSDTSSVATAAAQPGRTVQGHRTTVLRSADAVELIVHDFEVDRDVNLVGGTKLVTLDDLYSIADGLRWR